MTTTEFITPTKWLTLLLWTVAVIAPPTQSALAQSDDFDDGNDDGWTRFSPLNAVGVSSVFTFPDDGRGGQAYRMESPAPAVNAAGPARTFSYLADSYSDFYAAVDILDWDNDLNQAYGFLFRADNIGLGQTTGYVMNYDPQQGSGGRGQIQFNIVTGEAASGTIGAANLSLQPGRSYRFIARIEGAIFTGQVYDLNDLTSPIVTYRAQDELYSTGVIGLFNFYRGGSATDPVAGIADTTFDNYFAAATDPALVPVPGTARGIDGWPHVIGLEPLNRTAYHPADAGIAFMATTLTDEQLTSDQIRLSLNGVDVSSTLETQVGEGGTTVSFANLIENRVYDAEIELSNAAGQTSITDWTFDTFSEEYLESAEVKIIEVEDYNYDGGKFIDDPPPSGLNSSGNSVNGNTGYLDREGVVEVDFFDYASTAAEEDAAFRIFDPVGTQAGAAETFEDPVNDTIRKKYADLELPEYQVMNTEGGEWLNYTRDFPENTYHAYLRVAGRATQDVLLGAVSGDPSQTGQTVTPLGAFPVPNMGMEFNYRFVALVDDQGNKVRLDLSGIQTLRLTLGGEREGRTDETMALNYVAFVPAPEETVPEIVVTSSPVVTGPFEVDATAVIGETTITIPMTRDTSFYSFLLAPEIADTFAIQSVAKADNNYIITYSR